MAMSKEGHGLDQDIITEFETSIPVPSTSKDAFFPEIEKKPEQQIMYVTLSERMKFYHTPGVSIACIWDYDIQWAGGFGIEKANSEREVTPTTIFEAASTTKFLNAILVLRLVEQGLLNLTEDVNSYHSSWKIPDNGFTRLRPVTLMTLLTHTAGLPPTNFNWKKGTKPTLLDVLKGQFPAINASVEVRYTPGTRYEYSNLSHVIIQFLLEEIFHKAYPEIMNEKVFQPLRMTHSYFPGQDRIGQNDSVAFPHDKEGKMHPPIHHPSALAQGGLLTTPTDLAKVAVDIMRAYKGEADRYLTQKSVFTLFENHGDLGDKMIGIPLYHGLGCFVHQRGNEFMFTHPGYNIPGMLSYFYGYPKSGRGGVIMINGEYGERLAYEVIHALNRLQ
jgi:CubicO group peptidase (beta-lactamase class C family)